MINDSTLRQFEREWFDRWWPQWHDLYLYGRNHRFQFFNFGHGRNGINVSTKKIRSPAHRLFNHLHRAPTSGGQYHWVSEFAPPSTQKFLSYITGWVCVLGWHTGIAGCSYTVANMLIGIISINFPETYTPQGWHGSLLVIGVASIAIIFNTFLAQKLPLIEGVILILHVCGFFAVLIPLWVLAPINSAEKVFETIEDRGGWGNNGLACLVGLTAPIYALIGMTSSSRILSVDPIG